MSLDDFTASLGEDYAGAWMGSSGNGVEPGDKIVGKIVDISEAYSDQSEDMYPIITIHNEETNQSEAVHCFWITLVNGIERYNLEIGDRIGIAYIEDKENRVQGRKPTKIFRVKVEGKTPQVLRKKRQRPNQPVQQSNTEDLPVPDDEDTPF